MNLYVEDYQDGYYHIGKDLEDYPNAAIYVVYSGRICAKTYSTLWYMLRNKKKFAYIRRKKKDIDKIFEAATDGIDMSPFVAINRDMHTNYTAKKFMEGMAMIFDNEECTGDEVAWVFSMNSAADFRGTEIGIDLEYLIVDEFVPSASEINVSRQEGARLLDLYMSLCRDRKARGLPTPKLILLSNTCKIDCPIINQLEIADDMLELNQSGKEIYFDTERLIFFHHVNRNNYSRLREAVDDLDIVRTMRGTAWYDENIDGQFMVDLGNICKENLKGYQCKYKIILRRKPFYVYFNPIKRSYYATDVPHVAEKDFDFEKIADCKNWIRDESPKIQDALRRRCFKSSKWTYFDCLIHYNGIRLG